MNIWDAVAKKGLKESVLTPEQRERIALVRNTLGTRRLDDNLGPLAFRYNSYNPYASGTIQYGTLLHAPLMRQSITCGLTSIDDE